MNRQPPLKRKSGSTNTHMRAQQISRSWHELINKNIQGKKMQKTLQLIKHQICTTSSMYHGNGPLAAPIIWHSPYIWGSKVGPIGPSIICMQYERKTNRFVDKYDFEF